jgi:cell fate regulator YaaT (PSP1 superfamily)
VNTSAAHQQLSLNPQKLAEQCGKKCCLNYELDTYMDALKGFQILNKISYRKGDAICQKQDIFKV